VTTVVHGDIRARAGTGIVKISGMLDDCWARDAFVNSLSRIGTETNGAGAITGTEQTKLNTKALYHSSLITGTQKEPPTPAAKSNVLKSSMFTGA
jgi:hypothetical protein